MCCQSTFFVFSTIMLVSSRSSFFKHEPSIFSQRVTHAVAVSLVYYIKRKERKIKKRAEIYYRDNSPCSSPKIRRRRTSVEEIYEQLGPTYFTRAYRMSYESFVKLVEKISPYLPQSDACMARVNGPISDATRVAVALRYFAGGSPLDIGPLYGNHVG